MKNPVFISVFAFLSSIIAAALPAAGAFAQTFEYDVDRLGGDIDRVQMVSDVPQVCAALCKQNDDCVAFTYTPSGFNGYDRPQCWLKDTIPDPVTRGGTVSGLIPERVKDAGDAMESRAEARQEAIDQCTYSTGIDPDCLARIAVERSNNMVCYAGSGRTAIDCMSRARALARDKCARMSGEDRALCIQSAALGLKAPDLCDGADIPMQMECKVTVAADLQDPNIILNDPRLRPEERDRYAVTYAIMAQDYDALSFINDNRLYDQALIAISANRIGAGKHVDPAVCNSMAGGYDNDFEGGMSADQIHKFCQTNLAMGRAMVDYANSLPDDDLAELERTMMDIIEGTSSDLSNLPPELRASFEEYLAASKEQAPAQEPLYYPPPDVDIPPSANEGQTCIFGIC